MKKLLVTGLFFCIICVSYAQKQAFSPYTADYLEFYNQKITGTYSATDELGHPLGYIPHPFSLQFQYIDSSKLFRSLLKSTGSTLPSRYDLRSLGMVTSMKDQGGGAFGGNCWTFTTMAAIESQWLKLGLGAYDLSEQNIAACHGYQWGFGEGGNDMIAMGYLTRLAGPVAEGDDPYDVVNHACDKGLPVVAYVPETRWLPNNIQIIKRAIMTYGAVSTSMSWQNSAYSASNYSFFYSGNKVVNHAVTIVGWDDDYQTPAGKGAWIIKNQWGSNWAESGYFYISYYDKKINTTASFYPSRKQVSSIDKIYYYDTLSAIRLTGFRTSTAYGLTKFIAAGTETLSMAGTFIQSAGTLIDVEVYDEFVNDTLKQLRKRIINQYCDLPGWYTFDVPCIVTDDFYIRIKYYSPGNETPLPIEIVADTSFAQPHILNASGLVNASLVHSFHTRQSKPAVKYSLPLNNETNVPADIPFSITLNQKCDSVNFTGIVIVDSLNNPVAAVSGLWNKPQKTITILHANLQSNKPYTLIIPSGAVRNPEMLLNDTLRISFRSRLSGLEPAFWRPATEMEVSSDSFLTVKFTEKIVITDTLQVAVRDGASNLLSGIKLMLDTGNRVLSVKHNTIRFNLPYTLYIYDSAVKTIASGLFNDTLIYGFTTLAKPDTFSCYPRNRAQSVPLNTSLYCTFMGSVDSVNFKGIHIKDAGFAVYDSCESVWDEANNTIILYHDVPLKQGSRYYIVVPANSVKNKQGVGNKIFYWTINTVAAGTLLPVSITPGWNEKLSDLDTVITFTYADAFKVKNLSGITITDELSNPVGGVSVTVSSDYKSIRVSHASFAMNKTYYLSFPDSAIENIGFNWVSEDGKNWIPVGQGNKGYEYDLCIKAYVDTSSGPVPSFIASKREACKGSNVIFTDETLGSTTSWKWDFGAGASLAAGITGQGPHTVTYSTTGLKNVKLVVSGPGGTDSVIRFNYINVTDGLTLFIPGERIEIPLGSSDTLKAFGSDTIYWLPTYNLDTTGGPAVVFTPPNLGTFVFYAYGISGSCSGYDSVFVDVTQRPVNDNICNALSLSPGINGPFNNQNAGVQNGEPYPPNNDCNTQKTWCFEYNAPILKNSLWFKFIVPSSGKASFSTADPLNSGIEIDCQIALYKADSCIDLLSGNYALIAANDDFFDQQRHFAAAIQRIDTLEPGAVYWLQVDGSAGGDAGNFYVVVTEWGVDIQENLTDQPARPVIYPNPTSHGFNLMCRFKQSSDVLVQLLTVNNIPLLTKVFANISVVNEYFDISRIPPGTYLLKITSGEGVSVNKVIRK